MDAICHAAWDLGDGTVFFYWCWEFFSQPLSVHDGTSTLFLNAHRLCGAIEGRLSHFLWRWLRTGSHSVISPGTLPWNSLPGPRINLGPWRGQTLKSIHSSTELSWLTLATWLAKYCTGGSYYDLASCLVKSWTSQIYAACLQFSI